MRRVEIPSPCILETIPIPPSFVVAEGGSIEFAEFVESLLDGYQAAGQGLANIRKAIKILEVVRASKGDTVELEEDHWQFLKQAVDASAWNPKRAREMLPFMTAIAEAQEKKPDDEAGEED